MKNKISLEVIETNQKYVGRNLVAISNEDMQMLEVVSGDIIKIGNKKSIYLRAIKVNDEFQGKISLDGESRSVLGLSVGETTTISKAEKIPKLKSVTLAILPHESFSNEQLKSYNSQLKDSGEFKKMLIDSPASLGQKIAIPTSVGKLAYSVTKMLPKKTEFGLVSDTTKIEIADDIGEGSGTNIYYEDIGGLKEEIEKIREMVEFPMKHPDIFQRLGISAPKGVLMTGPPGTGKTLLAKAVATETDATFISIAGPEIMSKYHGGSEENLRKKFEEAEKNTPAIIFIDEIDAIAPKRGESHDQAEKRVTTQLLTLMDGLKSRGQVVVMAATNRPEDLDEAIRRPGRFDRELRINPPTEDGRKEILQIHTRNMPLDEKEKLLEEFSNKTIGYTGADLEVLCKEAALHSVKPFYNAIISIGEQLDEEDSEKCEDLECKKKELLNKIIISREDFVYAMKMVEPSAMREVLIKKPNVKWTDVAGLKEAKEKLRELVELPLLRPDLYRAAGIKPSKGILLHGPPGTGKTLLAKAVANESNANFISVKGPELISKWVGESEKHIREIFKKANQVSPSIIFFDEFDSISKSRGSGMGSGSSEKVVNQLLTELDGVEELENVIIIAATNRKDLIDPALLRPGRIESHVELTNPDDETILEIFKVHTREMPLDKSVSLKELAKKTKGWNGAEIESTCRRAGLNAIKRNYKETDMKKLKIIKEDFESAILEISKTINKPLEEKKEVKKKPKK
ncbi:CDC48 family AAA ATPase [archaeon]|jgi:transitional endoplasmic reticulum ATPase|nr:CDC48 family AAA ATPase [archaeon]MBT7128749.1 CDC48 family AAA ATPase [archaeon]